MNILNNLIRPIRNFIAKRAKLFLLIVLVFLLAAGGLGYYQFRQNSAVTPQGIAKLEQLANFPTLETIGNTCGVASDNIAKSEVTNPKGTAILIVQNHCNPGTDPLDSINDSATVTQGQIYKLVSDLTQHYDIKFVMAEGDLNGPVPTQKITDLTAKIKARNELSSQLTKLDNLTKTDSANAAYLKQVITDTQAVIAAVDREVELVGAPYQLKAEGRDFVLYGAENADTLAEDTNIVRDYIYLQDRQAQLANNTPSQTSSGGITSILQQFGTLLGRSSDPFQNLQSDLNNPSFTNAPVELQQTIEGIRTSLQAIQQLRQAKTATQAPSRQDNPYASITDPNKINSLIKDAEQKIQSEVIDRRNRETAQNFAAALKQLNQKVGILQFGAGHQEGLVKELNNQGLSVIIITPEEVQRVNSPATNQPATDDSNSSGLELNNAQQQILNQLGT